MKERRAYNKEGMLGHESKRPSFMSSKVCVCPRCGNPERGNVVSELLEACSYCAMSASTHVEKHPEEYGVAIEKKEARKFKATIDRHLCEKCHKPFQPTSNRQRACPGCRKLLRNDRDRKSYRE